MSNKILLLFVLMSLLIGCSGPNVVNRDPVIFSVLYNERAASPYQADWLVLQEYQQRQNVTLDVRLGDDSDYGTAVSQTFAAGNIPDIVLKVYPDQVESYATTGLLLPVSEYEQWMPHFKAYIAAHNLQAEVDKLRMKDGKLYILPGFQRQIQVQQWIYRQDAFEQNNIPTPTTYDELFDALVTLKGIYPDSTPLTAVWGGAHLFAMMGAGFGIPAGWNGTNLYDAALDTWDFSPGTENYRLMLAFLHRCYAAGILDPELFTQTEDEFYAKIQDGRALVTVTWITSGFANWNAALEQNGIPGGEWAPLRVPASTIEIRALPPVNPFRKGLVISSQVASQPYLEDLVRFLDWAVYSEEGMTLTTWGVEGVTFENTPDGKTFLAEIKTPRNPAGTIDITTSYGLDTFFNLNENEEFEDYKKPAAIVDFLNDSLNANEAEALRPVLKLDAQSTEAIRLVNELLSPYISESMLAFITGELSLEDDWESYLSELQNRGAGTLVEIWNAAWTAQNE